LPVKNTKISRHQLKLLTKRRKQKLDYDAESIALKIASDTCSKVIERQLFRGLGKLAYGVNTQIFGEVLVKNASEM
jgi:hypothetical protein